MSLTFALRAIAEGAGYELEPDDLNAALGLSLMMPAVPDEDDLAGWPMYARDAFLVEAGRLFGMSIRDIHPPEAARGLSGAQEFDQHFDASYRPLILRALEHGQAVLAWQGWPGERAMMWGTIRNSSSEGSGFQGVCPILAKQGWGTEARGSPKPRLGKLDGLTLERPPVQVYVVETITATRPNPDELVDVALDHAWRVLSNGLKNRFGVVTGPPAYDAWIARWRAAGCRVRPGRTVKSTPNLTGSASAEALASAGRSPTEVPALAHAHRQLALCVTAAHFSAIRFLNRQHQRTEGTMRRLVKALMQECHQVVTSLEESIDVASDAALTRTSEGRTRIVEAITRAKDATSEMLCATELFLKEA